MLPAFTYSSTMALFGPTLLLVAIAGCLASASYIAELTSYTIAVIQQLALRQPGGTFECVVMDLQRKDPFDTVLGDVLRSPKLDHVVKFVIGSNFAGDPEQFPRDPSLVLVYTGASYDNVRQIPRNLAYTLFQFSAKTKMLVFVNLDYRGTHFRCINELVAGFRFSTAAFLGTNQKTHVILVPRGKTLNVFELFKAPFTTEAWIVLLLIIISLEVLSFILPAQFRNDPALLLICGLERYDLHKANRWEKMILFAFIVFFFLMTNAYETKIISMMASKPTHRSIRTFEELVKAGIPTKANFNHVVKLDLGLLNETLQNATEDLSSMDGVSAYLATRTKSEIFLPIQYFDDSLQRTSYVIMAETLGLLIGALQTSDRNPLQDVLEASHATFVEGGLLGHYTERMKMQYFYARRKTQPQTEKTLLAIDDLSPAWIALGVGFVASFLLFCCELPVGRYKRKRDAERR
ncbi:conserved hypothetical protein [Culex quinquefasciatus]|uniref:Ionotropic glutamate receptor C-terminal domain-containing protein n=1 Tax=Culex quinquefasciatus TaxID=7176 RepID=B0XE26_CULQU|nr:conserved hypothetical protein [Culex quinquefasciatus]|eukprot:XP_001867898.1 conserved hypothetical protein [Culex quinquefasciatus]